MRIASAAAEARDLQGITKVLLLLLLLLQLEHVQLLLNLQLLNDLPQLVVLLSQHCHVLFLLHPLIHSVLAWQQRWHSRVAACCCQQLPELVVCD
jgi:hypothetical protein